MIIIFRGVTGDGDRVVECLLFLIRTIQVAPSIPQSMTRDLIIELCGVRKRRLVVTEEACAFRSTGKMIPPVQEV